MDDTNVYFCFLLKLLFCAHLILMPWNISVLVWKGSTVVQLTPGQSRRPSVRLSMNASEDALEVQ